MSTGHVFISYATGDRVAAQQILEFLESRGIRGWIAPRDVAPGTDYADQIMKAIETSVAFVSIVSERANTSDFVRAELELAFSRKRPIFPIRLDDAKLAAGLKIFLQLSARIDAFGDHRNANLEALAKHLSTLAGPIRAPAATPSGPPTRSGAAGTRGRAASSDHIFVSHSYKDRDKVNGLVASLESRGLRTWIGPRDFRPGLNFMKETGQAIEDCGAFVVVVTDNSNKSEFVHSETGLAYLLRKPIFPVRLGAIQPAKELTLALSLRQWTDAFGLHRARNVDQLVRELAGLNGEPIDIETIDGSHEDRRFRSAIAWAMIGLLLMVILVVFLMR